MWTEEKGKWMRTSMPAEKHNLKKKKKMLETALLEKPRQFPSYTELQPEVPQ